MNENFSYRVHLSMFDGPLDLLLHLIEKAELDIKDVFISDITSQYIEALEALDTLDMDSASEFISVAATLLLIKSRSLLPRHKEELQDEEESPEAELIRRLREYKACKEAAQALYELESTAGGSFTKAPEEFPLPPQTVEVLGGSVVELHKAFAALLASRKAQRGYSYSEVRRDAYTIEHCAMRIRSAIRGSRTLRFVELFPAGMTRDECVVMFIALLELLSLGELRVEQQQLFGDIWIRNRN